MKRRTRAAAGKTVKARSRGALNLKRATAPRTIATHGPPSKEAEVARRPQIAKYSRLRVCAKVARRPVDFLAIFAAGVASIAIVINAVFLQSGSNFNSYPPSYRKHHESLKSESERLHHKIDNASTRIKVMETRSGAWRRY